MTARTVVAPVADSSTRSFVTLPGRTAFLPTLVSASRTAFCLPGWTVYAAGRATGLCPLRVVRRVTVPRQAASPFGHVIVTGTRPLRTATGLRGFAGLPT